MSGILLGSVIIQLPLVIGLAIPTWSISCIAPLPSSANSAEPLMDNKGDSECIALANPGMALDNPGVV